MALKKFVVSGVLASVLWTQSAMASVIVSSQDPAGARIVVTEVDGDRVIFHSCLSSNTSACELMGRAEGYAKVALKQRADFLKNETYRRAGTAAAILAVSTLLGGGLGAWKFKSVPKGHLGSGSVFQSREVGVGVGIGALVGTEIVIFKEIFSPDVEGPSNAMSSPALSPKLIGKDAVVMIDGGIEEMLSDLTFALSGIDR